MTDARAGQSDRSPSGSGALTPSTERRRIPNASLYVILVAIIVLMTALNPERFPTLSNLQSMLSQLPILAFLSIGMMISMLSGGINLAIVSTANFTGIITALTLRALTAGDSASAMVVVYKVDRLTRSLADFAKIVEVFDAQGVSFVSVTQAFNTTTSMGRLTLNAVAASASLTTSLRSLTS